MRTGFDFSDIYDEVTSRAGGEQSTAEDVIRVRRGMRIVLERWEARRLNTWRIRQMRVTTGSHEPYVQLPDCVDDVMQVTWEDGGFLRRVSSAFYQQIAQKNQEGRPGNFWLAREECPKLYLHPAGSGYNLDVWYVERPADFDRNANIMDDVPGRWMEALICAMAHDLACKRPGSDGSYSESLISRLKAQAAEAEEIAIRADRERTPYRYRIKY
jgi:hypothetical protein